MKEEKNEFRTHRTTYFQLSIQSVCVHQCIRCNRNRLLITHIPIQTIYSKNFENATIYHIQRAHRHRLEILNRHES